MRDKALKYIDNSNNEILTVITDNSRLANAQENLEDIARDAGFPHTIEQVERGRWFAIALNDLSVSNPDSAIIRSFVEIAYEPKRTHSPKYVLNSRETTATRAKFWLFLLKSIANHTNTIFWTLILD